MSSTTYSIIYALERARQSARDTAAALADMGDAEGSVYHDGIAAGLTTAIETVRNPPDGRAIIY